MNYRYSLHKIYNREHCTFDTHEYSRFKFGNVLYAEKFAKELFQGFVSEYGDLILKQNQIILLPSPHHTIPTASSYLCSFFKRELNFFLFRNEKSTSVESKIYRNQTYVQDYGNMNYEERLRLISNDTYYIDKEFIEGKFCILIDDIKITGSHEDTVNRILKEYNVSGNFLFLYYAELMNSHIHPNIENDYNYAAVKKIEDLLHIVTDTNFRFNTRVIKYVLLMGERNFEFLIEGMSEEQKRELFYLAISNNYHLINEYKCNINKLWQLIYKKDREKVSLHRNLPLV
ncbi:MAG: phosphoribosyltransferase family protein [Capnocytophaga felis]|nr:phosphoribosyltransferase family protein [Capnocytophaga felis]